MGRLKRERNPYAVDDNLPVEAQALSALSIPGSGASENLTVPAAWDPAAAMQVKAWVAAQGRLVAAAAAKAVTGAEPVLAPPAVALPAVHPVLPALRVRPAMARERWIPTARVTRTSAPMTIRDALSAERRAPSAERRAPSAEKDIDERLPSDRDFFAGFWHF